jgi:cob(I)alamin adenosyltransferase
MSAPHASRMARKKAVIDRHIAAADTERGVLVVNTGTGKGKSSAAFGLVARALGHGMKVAVIQFVKSRSDTGEEAFFRRFPNQVRWHVMGEGFTWESQNDARDAAAAQAAWQQALAYLGDPSVGMLVLDEITYAFKYGWLDVADAIRAFAVRPPMQHVVVTGRAAPRELIEAADTVSEVRMTKHAFAAGVKAMPGVEF